MFHYRVVEWLGLPLLTCAASMGQEASPDVGRDHLHGIDLARGEDFADLEFLGPLLRGKRVVLLGESNHGAREFFLHKNRLIRFLHEELGFEVLLLESGIGEVFSLNYERAERSPQEMLAAGLIGPWRSSELSALMDYVKATPSLFVGGYDVQRSGRSFGAVLGRALDTLAADLDDDARRIEDRFSAALPKLTDRRRAYDEETAAEIDRLRADYAALLERLRSGEAALVEGPDWSAVQGKLLRATLRNRLSYLDYFRVFRRDGDFRKRWAARDVAMAENVLMFADELFPDAKLIVSGHNFHVARHNRVEHVAGEVLAERFGDTMYSIGFFAGSGAFANDSREPERMGEPTEARDLQRIIADLDVPTAILDVPSEPGPGLEWLFDDVIVNHTFLDLDGSNEITLGRAFDALLLVSEVSPARY